MSKTVGYLNRKRQATCAEQLFVPTLETPDVDDRATDPFWFAELHRRFHFTVDAASSDENARLPRHWTIVDDGLAQPWAGERVWCNPPFSCIHPWVHKAALEQGGAELIVMLLPANRTEQGWWQQFVEPCRDGRHPHGPRTEFLAGRPRFLKPGQLRAGINERPPFGCVLLIWGS